MEIPTGLLLFLVLAGKAHGAAFRTDLFLERAADETKKQDSDYETLTFTDGSSKLYRLVTEKANFDEAVQICKEEDAYLAEFMNSEQMEKVGDLAKTVFGHQSWFFGLTDSAVEGEFVYSHSGSSPQYTKWAEREPSGSDKNGDKEDCVEAKMGRDATWSWNDVQCSRKGYFICQKESEFFMIDDYYYYFASTMKTHSEASQYCKDRESYLGEFYDADHMENVKSQAQGFFGSTDSCWFGLACDGEGNFAYTHMTGEPEFTAWASGEPSTQCPTDGTNGTVCAKISPGGAWMTTSCEEENKFLCFKASMWSEWTGYGSCSGLFGDCVKQRTRNCYDIVTMKNVTSTRCGDPRHSFEEILCDMDTECPAWTEWSPSEGFGTCSRTCGTGYQNRTRDCMDPLTGSSTNKVRCGTDANIQLQECNQHPCPNAVWASWSVDETCPDGEECGPGNSTWTRHCIDADGEEAEDSHICATNPVTEKTAKCECEWTWILVTACPEDPCSNPGQQSTWDRACMNTMTGQEAQDTNDCGSDTEDSQKVEDCACAGESNGDQTSHCNDCHSCERRPPETAGENPCGQCQNCRMQE